MKDVNIRIHNQGPTITFIKTTKKKTFGGFTTQNWEAFNKPKAKSDP